jgi:hypothetical protein
MLARCRHARSMLCQCNRHSSKRHRAPQQNEPWNSPRWAGVFRARVVNTWATKLRVNRINPQDAKLTMWRLHNTEPAPLSVKPIGAPSSKTLQHIMAQHDRPNRETNVTSFKHSLQHNEVRFQGNDLLQLIRQAGQLPRFGEDTRKCRGPLPSLFDQVTKGRW